MSVIEEKCKQKGVRLTDQRKVIAKILSESKEIYGSKDHPDVDELHKRVTSIDDKIFSALIEISPKLPIGVEIMYKILLSTLILLNVFVICITLYYLFKSN